MISELLNELALLEVDKQTFLDWESKQNKEGKRYSKGFILAKIYELNMIQRKNALKAVQKEQLASEKEFERYENVLEEREGEPLNG